MTDTVLIIDFGSQVTQLIARRVREAGVYSEIVPFNRAEAAIAEIKPRALILSGGPASVTAEGSPRAPQAIFASGLPILSICYGQQTTAVQLGGTVEGGHAAEFGRAEIAIREKSALFDGIWEVGKSYPVWMSHGDRVTRLPEGFTVKATSENAPFAVASDEGRRIYTTMFHPEVVHTPDGAKLLANFVHKIAGLPWRLDHGAFSRQRGRAHQEAGRGCARDRRAVGRRRFRGCLRADPRGDRRPAHLHLRRPRAAAPERGRRGRPPVPRALQHPARARRCEEALPRCAGRRRRP